MMVRNNAYGIRVLGGPQILFAVARDGYYAYLKYATVATSFTAIEFSDAEWAVGGGWQFAKIGPRGHEKRLYLTLDLSFLKYSSPLQGKALSLGTASLGVSADLFSI